VGEVGRICDLEAAAAHLLQTTSVSVLDQIE
jgi:hypothetical protein